MSGIPRTGLFARNHHLTALTQRNRALANGENVEKSDNSKDSNMLKSSSLDNLDSPNSSYASLPRDREGFDDLDAYFNRASTPQKTPKSQLKSQSEPSVAIGSRLATPSSHRKAATSVLVAKPLKMISSKIAEHYKKEPRLEVSMGEAEAEMRQRELELELELEKEREIERERERELEKEREQDRELQRQQERELQRELELKPKLHNSPGDERIQRAKRELEEMSINSSFDYNATEHTNDHTEVNIASYIKSVPAPAYVNDEYDMMPANDDVLMDRLVEEMLVNDQEFENSRVNIETVEPLSTDAGSVPDAPEKKVRGRKPKAAVSSGMARRTLNHYAGTDIDDDGLRRSCRMKMEPLRFWANEKVCYGRAEDPSITHPVIVNVIKKPELDDPTFMMGLTRKRRRPTDPNATKLRSQGYGPDCDVETDVVCYDRPDESELRLVALSHHHVQGDEVKDSSFRIHTIFTEGNYMSSGQLIFPPGSSKPAKNSSRHALVFYVIAGSFRIEINRESFLIGVGGQFHVPRSNYYTITHVTPPEKAIEGRLFFCHCKDNAEL